MNPKDRLVRASLALGTVGLVVLATASGCGPAPDTTSVSPDAAVFPDSGAPDASPDADPGDDGSVLMPGACPKGTADCDGDPRNGCEAKLDADPKNCGACKHDCTGLPHVSGATTCSAGKCVVPASSCAHGFAHCSTNPDDGCEADLSKPATCGACGTSCSGATPICSSGACSNGCSAATPTQCSGSCVDTTTNAANCNGCGNACPTPAHGQATCAASACGFACNTGYHACGGACADDTSPLTCGTSCTPCSAPANGYATCGGGACDFACNPGFHRCGNGCASDSDATACGASCAVCTVPSGAGHATCSAGTCGIQCDAGDHLCGASTCASNSSVATCGTSCTPCAAPPSNGHATCDGTSCGIACDGGYHQCGGACDSNASVQSCGASCTPCPTPANAQPTCNGVACGFTCNAGFADCDGNAANGCEVNLGSDANNCNACGHSCLGGACSASACQPVVLTQLAGPGAIDVVLDPSYAYFRSGSAIYRVTKATHALRFLWQEPNPVNLASLAADGTNLYTGTVKGKIYRVAMDGSTSALIFTSSMSTYVLGPLAVGGNSLYFANDRVDVASIRLDGTGFTTTPFQLSGATGIVADAADGYFAGWWTSTAGILSFSGTGISASTSPVAEAIAMDASHFYWTSSDNGSSPGKVGRMNRDGTSPTILVSQSGLAPGRVAVDATNVYYTVPGGGTIARVPIVGGAPVTIASAQTNPSSIAVDASAIYWTNSGNGTLMMVAK